MEAWEDYYDLLGVGQDADERQIKEAYRCWAQILHPDRLMNASESVRMVAQRQLVRVNRAYGVLSNADKRAEFHRRWLRIEEVRLPSVVIIPLTIDLSDIVPGRPQRATFHVIDNGGPYRTLEIRPDDDCVRVCSMHPLFDGCELPTWVTVEVTVGRRRPKDELTVSVVQDGEYVNSVYLMLESPLRIFEELRC
jgi:hypothetical protein